MQDKERPDYKQVHFTVAAEGAPAINVRVEDPDFRSFLEERRISPIREWVYNELLPPSQNGTQTVARLQAWHASAPNPQSILKDFDRSINRLFIRSLGETKLGKLLKAMRDFSDLGRGSYPRFLVKIEDFRCVVPWEVLIHCKCGNVKFPPVVFRFSESGGPVRIDNCIAHVLPFSDRSQGEYPDTHLALARLVGWAIHDDVKPGIDLDVNPEARDYQLTGRKLQDSVSGNRSKILESLATDKPGIHYVFAVAKSTGKFAISHSTNLSLEDFRKCKQGSNICALFPVLWKRSRKATSLTNWLGFARAAYNSCEEGILGICTLYPMKPVHAASIAYHLSSAVAYSTDLTATANPTIIAEKLSDWLADHHPLAPELLLLVGNPRKPANKPPISVGSDVPVDKGLGKDRQVRQHKWHVGIMTVVPDEMVAVREILSQNPGYHKDAQQEDSVRYFDEGTLPAIDNGLHNIVCIRALQQGQHSIIPAYQALCKNYNPALIVLLGIGGSIHEDASLCDVVIADSIWYYDKRSETKLGTKHRGLSYNLKPWLTNEINRLFNDHGGKPSFLASTGSYSQSFNLLCGPIGTGNAVIKHREAKERKWLHTANEKVLAVDTEAGGVALSFSEERLRHGTKPEGYLIIRGISDHADKNKNDDWRIPAASNAMATLKLFLGQLPPGFGGSLPKDS